MDYIMEDVLSGELIPVLLGLSEESVETAKRLYKKYGVVSHVFCDKIPLPMRLTLCMKYHVIHHTKNEELLRRALCDFATQLGHADVILYLIPCTEGYANMVWEYREELECRFVIADKPEMQRVWFGEDSTLVSGGLR